MAQEVVNPEEHIEIPLEIDRTLTRVFAIAILSSAGTPSDQILAASVDHITTIPISPLTLSYEVPIETPRFVLPRESIILTEPRILSIHKGQVTIQCEDGRRIVCSQTELLDALCGVQRLALQPIYNRKLERAENHHECVITLPNADVTQPPFVLFFSGSTKSQEEFKTSAILSPETQFHIFLQQTLCEIMNQCAGNGRDDILSFALDYSFSGLSYREYLTEHISRGLKGAKVPKLMRVFHASSTHIRTLLQKDTVMRKIIGANAPAELAQSIVSGLTPEAEQNQEFVVFENMMDFSDYLRGAKDEELLQFAGIVHQMLAGTTVRTPKMSIGIGQRGETPRSLISGENPFPMRDASIDRILISIFKGDIRKDDPNALEMLAVRSRLHLSSMFPWAQYLQDIATHNRRQIADKFALYPATLLGEYLIATIIVLRAVTSDVKNEFAEDVLQLLTTIQEHIVKKIDRDDTIDDRIKATLPYAYLHDVIDVLYDRVDAHEQLNTSKNMVFHVNHTVSKTGIMSSRSETLVEIREDKAVLKQVSETDNPSPLRGTLTITHHLPKSDITSHIPREFPNNTILVTATMHFLVNGFVASVSRIVDENGNHMIEYNNVPGMKTAQSQLVYRQRISIRDNEARDTIAAFFGTHVAEQLYAYNPARDAVSIIKAKTKEPMFSVQL